VKNGPITRLDDAIRFIFADSFACAQLSLAEAVNAALEDVKVDFTPVIPALASDHVF